MSWFGSLFKNKTGDGSDYFSRINHKIAQIIIQKILSWLRSLHKNKPQDRLDYYSRIKPEMSQIVIQEQSLKWVKNKPQE